MTVNGLFVCEGTSDRPLAVHVSRLFRERGLSLVLTTPDFERIPEKVGVGVAAKLEAARRFGGLYDLLIVHRDSDSQGVEQRRCEISAAAERAFPKAPVVAVIPVRMTEAWLLLDEQAVRSVAGNPNGRKPLNLPKRHEVERIADPKDRLREVLNVAADCSGRRLDIFKRRFAEHRRLLLERLDPGGPVSGLDAWRAVVAEVEQAATLLGSVAQD